MKKNKPLINKIKIRNVIFGKNVKVVQPVNLYGCIIKDSVFIGPFVEIQKDVMIGKNTKIQSHTFICSKVKVGSNCFVGHGVMFINDKFSTGINANGDVSKWEPTIIEDNVYIGSNTTILPVKICKNVVIGAGSVVTKNIDVQGKYAGNPAKKIKN